MMKYYFLTIVAILIYRLVKLILFWIMSNKSANRVLKSIKATSNDLNIKGIITGIASIKNKGKPDDVLE